MVTAQEHELGPFGLKGRFPGLCPQTHYVAHKVGLFKTAMPLRAHGISMRARLSQIWRRAALGQVRS
jgi:hypothetical protein